MINTGTCATCHHPISPRGPHSQCWTKELSPDLFEQGWKEMKLGMFIILLPRGSLELDPSVLIDPFLIGIFPKTFPWKETAGDLWKGNRLCLWKPTKIKALVPYSKLLINLACSSRTGKYWLSMVFVLSRSRANNPLYNPRHRLIRGFYLGFDVPQIQQLLDSPVDPTLTETCPRIRRTLHQD